MLTLITGVPGSGKSLWAVKMILEAIRAKEDATKRLPKLIEEGDAKRIAECQALIRDIYVDIDGFDHDTLGTKPAPEDWRQTPDGSLVVYDECQQRFGPDGSGRSKREDISGLEIHRHTGHDIIFITQRERLIHSNIRDLIGSHYHIQRQFGTHTVKVYHRAETMDTSSTAQLEKVDMSPWQYDKKLFQCYKSATVHTHKRQVPAWLKRSLVVMGLALVVSGYLFYQSLGFFSGTGQIAQAADSASPTVQHQAQPSTPFTSKSSNAPQPVRLMGCAAWARQTRCQCYSNDGSVADVEFEVCMSAVSGSTLAFASQLPSDASKRSIRPSSRQEPIQRAVGM